MRDPQNPVELNPDDVEESPKKKVKERLKLSDKSSSPDINLMESIAHYKTPKEEDLAILEAWRWKPHQPIKYLDLSELDK